MVVADRTATRRVKIFFISIEYLLFTVLRVQRSQHFAKLAILINDDFGTIVDEPTHYCSLTS